LGGSSLLWKVDPIFERFRCFPAIAIGYRRVFAQLSMDHRGTPQAPGLVCTLISDSEHAEAKGRDRPQQPSRTAGLVYEIPRHQAVEIIEALDYREKGGYTRHIIDVELLEHAGLHSESGTGRLVAKAVVYKGQLRLPTCSTGTR
jgi:cation transport regulator ChaC